MHLSSLPGKYSIGSFGEEARRFVDFLQEGGFTYWQVLPFCTIDECNSPYKSLSAFGGNPYFIDLPSLYEQGLLTAEELEQAEQQTPYSCEYTRLSDERLELLRLAAMRVQDRSEIIAFSESHPELERAAYFMALRDANGGTPWQEWTENECEIDELFFRQFIEYEFHRQWMAVKEYANSKGILIIGDLPIYVAEDSADVWSEPEQFLLDDRGYPTEVAGVPPDYFSEEGQLWGNPLYDWKKMKKDGFSWWRRRIKHTLELFDGVRIDHFRGLESYWSVPRKAKSAKEGRWVKGPGRALINVIKEIAGERLIIAEDLGDITEEVNKLRRYSGFPGMRVFQFAFLGDPKTPHLPHNYVCDSVAYSGTHDNNTLLGYVWELSAEERAKVFAYCGGDLSDWEGGVRAIIRTLMASAAGTVILPIQDLLLFGSDTRMNTPGTSESNWAYRITEEQLASLDSVALRKMNELFDRARK